MHRIPIKAKLFDFAVIITDLSLFLFPKDSEDYERHASYGMYEELKEVVSKLSKIASDITGIMKLGGNNSFFLQHEKEKLSILNLKG